MKTINIYIKKELQETINKMKVRYQLSLTTILDIIVFETLNLIKNTNNNDFEKTIKTDYIKSKGIKTSIKEPKIFKMLEITNNEKTKICTNILEIYLKKEFKNYFKNNDLLNKFYSKCDSKMTNTYEENWNYNNFIRMQRRMLRQNKEYFKRALEQI